LLDPESVIQAESKAMTIRAGMSTSSSSARSTAHLGRASVDDGSEDATDHEPDHLSGEGAPFRDRQVPSALPTGSEHEHDHLVPPHQQHTHST
jgi:hypothetical protein